MSTSEPNQRSHPLLRLLNHKEASEAECELWHLAFGKKKRDILFRPVTAVDGTLIVDSRNRPYEQLNIPLSLGDWDSILVCSEYPTALKDIKRWFKDDITACDIPTPIFRDDYIWSRWRDFPASDDDDDDVHQSETQSRESGRSTLFLTSGNTVLTNNVDDSEAEAEAAGSDIREIVQIVGMPGIGKSLFLLYILAERLLRGLETCLQTEPNQFTLWCSEGTFKVFIDHTFTDAMKNPKNADILPMSTWYLFDSNHKISVPPVEIQCTHARIVQVSSFRTSCLKWVRKTIAQSNRYAMKPPTLKELILMRDCQHSPSIPSISNSAITDFFHKYGPSARQIFRHADNPAEYDKQLKDQVAQINVETLAALISDFKTSGLPHSLFGVYPGVSRGKHLLVNILTQYIYQLLKNAQDMDMRRMYRFFKEYPWTPAAAGYIFKDHLHGLLLKGGTWKVNQLIQSGEDLKNFSYIRNAESHAGSRWLCVGRLPYLANDKPQEAALPLELRRYDAQSITNSELTRSGIYYQPDSSMYDSHVVNTQEKQVMVFQFAVASKHDAKVSDLVWLKERYGDAGYKINYVVFADWDSDITIYIPRAYDSFLATKLLVRVTEDELFAQVPEEQSTTAKRRASEESDGQVSKKVCMEK
ncbi:hypothetical protein VNI00_008645 [Paramarasmius palmivorus]|uniref:Crinkler (CRN) family protein n=1 Tax=Paramarasmius palmivorus TaxID=297713 RepID=A0AAW0CV82_9AGAR